MYKFILTRELGRLSKWLRILGFDTVYYNSDNIATLIIQALRDDRIVITRKKAIGQLKTVNIQKDEIKDQLKEVISKLNLEIDEEAMFTRCVVCNELLDELSKEDVKDKVPEYVYNTQEEFYGCKSCKRIYWQGTHWGNVKKLLKEVGLRV
jgi:hypothetical protein